MDARKTEKWRHGSTARFPHNFPQKNTTMRSTSRFESATFFLCVAMAVASTGASAFRTLGEKDEIECFLDDDGLLACVQEDFPDRGFSTVFLECPETASSVHECERCEVIMTDEDTPNEIDLANKSLCTRCTVCQNIVAYDCSNLGEGDCSIRDCNGTCTASSSKEKPRFSDGLTRDQECVDFPEWQDSLGDACDYYEQDLFCFMFGSAFSNDGYTAKDACCVCGGGNPVDMEVTSAPTTEPTTPSTPEPSNESTISPTPESSSNRTEPPTPEPSPESTIPPTPESSPDSTIPPTPETTSPATPTPEPSPESTIPPSPESSPDSTIPPTPETTSPATLPSTTRPTPQIETLEPQTLEPESPDFSMQRFRAEGIKMTLDNVEPLDNPSSLRWQDITGQYMAVEMKETIGSKLCEGVEVSVSLTSQDPPFVSRRALISKKMSALRRLQTAEELTFDADISIQSDVDASTLSRHIKEILEKNEYLAALRNSGDDSLAKVESVSVTPVASMTSVEDPANNKPPVSLIVGSVVTGITVVCLAAYVLVKRGTNKLQRGPWDGKRDDASTTIDIYVEDGSKASSSKSSFSKWVPHRLGSAKSSAETTKGSTSEIRFAVADDVGEERLHAASLAYSPSYFVGDEDEESIGATTFSSITSGYSFPAADWSLPPARIADEYTVNSCWTKDDDFSVVEFEVRAPAGALGFVLESPNGGIPRVNHIYGHGPLAGRVRLGDRLIAVDGRNVTSMNAAAVSRLIASKKDNAVRELIFARPK